MKWIGCECLVARATNRSSWQTANEHLSTNRLKYVDRLSCLKSFFSFLYLGVSLPLPKEIREGKGRAFRSKFFASQKSFPLLSLTRFSVKLEIVFIVGHKKSQSLRIGFISYFLKALIALIVNSLSTNFPLIAARFTNSSSQSSVPSQQTFFNISIASGFDFANR